MSVLVLDAAALIALERRDRRVRAYLVEAHASSRPVLTSEAVVAQVWWHHARQHDLGEILKGTDTRPIAEGVGKELGALLGEAGLADVVDAHVATLCTPHSVILTSDPDDIRSLLNARGVTASVVPV